jgi:hypothetical protein
VIDVNSAAGKFRLETQDGEVLTFFVDEETQFRGKAESLEDMQEGWRAGVRARDEGGKLRAVLVVSGDLSELVKARGEVTQVDANAGKFRIKNQDGNILTFFVNEKTRYGGQIGSLEELEVGWQAAVAANESDDDKLIAIGVLAGDRPDLTKIQGEVTAVDSGAGKFELQKPDGNSVRIFVDENTRYQGQISSLDDLQVGWKAGVAGKEGEDGKLIAVLVIAGTRPEPVKAQGIIKSVSPGSGKFKLEKPDGGVLTIFANEETQYRGQVGSFSDLKKDMRAGVVAIADEDGNLIAKVVVAGKPREDRERPAPESETPLEPRPYDSLSVPFEGNT